jgi:glutamate-5-semialdehyde dehydrogenase
VTTAALTSLAAGLPIVFGGDRVTFVSPALAEAFRPGDRLVVVQDDGALLHVPAAEHRLVDAAVHDAHAAFGVLSAASDEAVSAFFEGFASRLDDDLVVAAVLAANEADVLAAKAAGRSTTRLVLSPKMRADMAAGLRGWAAAPSGRDTVVEAHDHGGWRVEQRRAPLGVVGFVFEGRPNVVADACGVLRSGNTTVLRIGSDALGTARAIVAHALAPALEAAGLPRGAVCLLDTPARAAGWALFSHPLLSLAVARGSGEAVAQLGAVARQAGVPVSLHGTGGAWLVVGASADLDRLEAVVYHSLDRKVCNTLNVCCVVRAVADKAVPRVLDAVSRAAERRGVPAKLHVAAGSEGFVPPDWFARSVPVRRAAGDVGEAQAEPVPVEQLGTEWEWEESPEISLVVVDNVDEAVGLCNRLSPRLVASLVSNDEAEHERFWSTVDAPFVGDGFTRWVDGQYALGRPELGLSNWQRGRLLARSAVLSGDSVHTVRTRAHQTDPDLHR